VNPDFCYETAKLGQVLCSGVCDVTAGDVERFRRLLGYEAAADSGLAPSSMGLTYGLRLGWEHSIFPPGVVRMGDDDVFGVPARVGDRLTTTFSIVEKFEKKGRRFLRYEMRTINQDGALVCAISFVGLLP
jgi:acyl dehydratase